MESKSDISVEINHLFRHEYGKLVAVLTKTFGSAHMELAEDVVQDALLEAVKQWSYNGIPTNPIGWIYKVAKNKAINVLNHEKHKHQYSSELAKNLQTEQTTQPILDQIFSDKEIADDQLRMMFTCCHPVVSPDSQIALTLKTLCGFSSKEIAKAFLTSEENIKKRLVRARKNIRDANVPFQVPLGKELDNRVNSILEVIYLLFNEGYNASQGQFAVRYELCQEAIRLAEIVASNSNITSKSNPSALLALMSLNASRFSSRTNQDEQIVDLENQDRSKWDQELIQKGLYYLGYSTQSKDLSPYHIMATISAHHCTSKDFASTDWESILKLYDNLIQLDPSPVVKLNKAVVLSKTKDAQTALNAIKNIDNVSSLESYLPYFTVRAELMVQNKENDKALILLQEALTLPLNESARSFITTKINNLSH